MVNSGGGIKSLGGAKLNLILSDVQSDTTVTRTETERLITNSKLSAIHGSYASALTLICLLYTSPSPRDLSTSRMPSSA